LAAGSGAYDHAYEDAMERINGQVKDQEELAKQVLSWITSAKRPLTTTEVQHALGVEVGESKLDKENFSQIEDMVSVCAGLVTVDEESSIIRLVHYTTQEYFDRTRDIWFPKAETDITIICITYLSFKEFESGPCQNDDEFEQRLQLHRLYHYASHNWGYHAQAASTLISEVNSFLEREAQVDASIQGLLAVKKRYSSDLEYSQRFPKEMTGLHLAVYFGVKAIVQLLLEKGIDVNSKASDGQTPLHYASQRGHVEVVQLLLEKGADVNAAADGSMPLHWTSEGGHVEVVQLLLEKGADMNTADKYGWTPLHWASDGRHVEVVQLLLEKGADVNTADKYGWTPLYWASKNKHAEVVQLLLEKGADVNATHEDGSTLLHRASEIGHIEVVQLLLKKGADVNAADAYGEMPLHRACERGHVEVFKLLLEKGADVNAAADGSMPLHRASEGGHVEVVQLLLEKGADMNTADKYGWTPLHWASENGHVEVVQLLLEKGADTAQESGAGEED
jgi:ankyrin repeat protein